MQMQIRYKQNCKQSLCNEIYQETAFQAAECATLVLATRLKNLFTISLEPECDLEVFKV
jgi:hypothetical protein